MTSLPAAERNLLVHLLAFCLIRSTIKEKRSLLRLPKCSGKPKYFPTPLSLWICSTSLSIVFSDTGAFREKVIADLSLFIDCPDACSYLLKLDLRAAQFSLSAWRKNIVSSAKKR
ncbi:unnamed protein product [Brassica oleracea var. botrytis]